MIFFENLILLTKKNVNLFVCYEKAFTFAHVIKVGEKIIMFFTLSRINLLVLQEFHVMVIASRGE